LLREYLREFTCKNGTKPEFLHAVLLSFSLSDLLAMNINNNLELAASSFALGACWAGYFNTAAIFWPSLQQELGFPEGNVSFRSMMVGYPKFKYQRLPLKNDTEIMWR
jgi:hypothetical protein